MLFNSFQFIFGFLPVALVVFYGLTRLHYLPAARAWLVLCSLAFYSYWDIRYLPLLLASITFNYLIGLAIQKAGKPKDRLILWFGAAVDLLLLGYFKYAMFLVVASNRFLDSHLVIPHIVLPLGISFFTFTQIAYLVDTYRGEVKDFHWLGYSLFVTFFPHLIAGPILWHKKVIPQFYRLRSFVLTNRNLALGLTIFIIGLAKKVLIADTLSPWVHPVFDNAAQINIVEAWAGALSYTFQIFFDFSGYSDMAVGLALLLNITIPINFESPYRTTSIIDFWRQWHISLSAFLRDYLYIPLGGNRHGKIRHYLNMFLTMLLGGIWHGAGWTFVAWGALHGAYLTINHAWRTLQIKLPTWLCWLATFLMVIVGWVFFRARNIGEARCLLLAMFGARGIELPDNLPLVSVLQSVVAVEHGRETFLVGGKTCLLMLGALFLAVRWLPSTASIIRTYRPGMRLALMLSCLLTLSLLSMNRVSEFLYFQF